MRTTSLGSHMLRYVKGRVDRGEIVLATARGLRNHLYKFAVFWGNRPITQLSPKAVNGYVAAMHKEGLAPSTQALRLSTLRGFARWAAREQLVHKDWTTNAPRIRRPRQVPHDMTNEHVEAVMAEADNPRDTAMLWLMFGCGLRCVEVSRLNVDDWDRRSNQLHVTGKGGHQRIIPMPPPTVQAVIDYLGWAGIRRGPGDGRGAHGLRAAAASDLYEACNDPLVVQEFLGHASLATGAIYLRRAKTSRIAAAQTARQLTLGMDEAA